MLSISVYKCKFRKLCLISIEKSQYKDFLYLYILQNLPSKSNLIFNVSDSEITFHYNGKQFEMNDRIYTMQEFFEKVSELPVNEIIVYGTNMQNSFIIHVGFKFKKNKCNMKLIGYLQSIPQGAKTKILIENLYKLESD